MIPLTLIGAVVFVMLGTMMVAATRRIDHDAHADPVPTRIGRLGLEHAGTRGAVGFLDARRVDDFGAVTFKTLSEQADYWESLGIQAAGDDGEGGDNYYLKRDDETLKKMVKRWAGMWPETQAGLRHYFRGRPAIGVRRDIDSTKIGGIPLTFDPQFFNLYSKDILLEQEIQRAPVDNKRVDWDSLATLQPAVWSTEGGGSIATQDDLPGTQTIDIKLMYARVTLTGLAQRVSQGAKRVNLMTQRTQARLIAMRELLEQTTFTGSGAAGSFKGFQYLFDTNEVNLSSTVIDLDDITELQKKCWKNGGGPTMAFAPHDVVVKIGSEQEENSRVEKTPTTVGLSGWAQLRNVVIHNGMPIFGTRFLADTAGAMQMFAIQPSVLSYPVLLDYTLVPLGAEDDDTESWLIKAYLALKDLSANDFVNNDGTGGQYHGRMKDIAVV